MGLKLSLHGRALLLNRNVGHLMTNPGILLEDNSEIPEGILWMHFFQHYAQYDLRLKKTLELDPSTSLNQNAWS